VEIPAEFQLQASDVNEHARRAILDQVGEKSYRILCLETIEITRSKACSDWWKQFPESHWPIKQGIGSLILTRMRLNRKVLFRKTNFLTDLTYSISSDHFTLTNQSSISRLKYSRSVLNGITVRRSVVLLNQ